jgi:hypothetical protein
MHRRTVHRAYVIALEFYLQRWWQQVTGLPHRTLFELQASDDLKSAYRVEARASNAAAKCSSQEKLPTGKPNAGKSFWGLQQAYAGRWIARVHFVARSTALALDVQEAASVLCVRRAPYFASLRELCIESG